MLETIIPVFGLRTPISAATHSLGFLLALGITFWLWRLSRPRLGRQLMLLCFGLSAALLYAASATYHALVLPPMELLFFQRLDHSAIYLLIAGSYTPPVGVLMRPSLRRDLLLASIWGLAFAGIASKWLPIFLPYWLVVTPYLALGWIGVFAVRELAAAVGKGGMGWIIFGGLAYSVGAVLDWIGWPVLMPQVFGAHELFHVLTMLGTFCHAVFMVRYVVPYTRSARIQGQAGLSPILAPVVATAALQQSGT